MASKQTPIDRDIMELWTTCVLRTLIHQCVYKQTCPYNRYIVKIERDHMFGINGEILVDVKVSRTEAKDVLSVPLSHHFYKSHRVKMFMQDLHRSLSCFEAIFTNFN